jgi:hypothetical protein
MKYLKQLIVTVCLFLLPGLLIADDYGDHKGWFKCQKDIENDVSDYSQYSATVNYNGKLYNYIYYSGSSRNKIIVRAFDLKSNLDQGEVAFTDIKYDNDDNLKVSNHYFQPAPVVYGGLLFLFLQGTDDMLSYSVYDKANGGYQKPVHIPDATGTHLLKGGMAATVLDGRLCLFFKGNSGVYCYWTEDETLKDWHLQDLGFNNGGDSEERFGSLSAISTTILENGKRKGIAMIGYVTDSDAHAAKCRTYKIGESGDLEQVGDAVKISDLDDEYNCVALAVGSVKNDPNSKGNCVQAFLKRDNKDNGYCRYRIQRWESKNNGATWTNPEDNLVKKNYEWADHELNLSVANLAVPIHDVDTSDLRQYICLIYRGYDDVDHPLNCAWAETDKAVWKDYMIKPLKSPKATYYIGYIEGPPPFVMNGSNSYHNTGNSDNISEVKFVTSVESSKSKDYEFSVGGYTGGTIPIKSGWGIRVEVEGAYQKKNEKETSLEVTHSYSKEAAAENSGLYIFVQPTIRRDHYIIYDREKTAIDSAYFFRTIKYECDSRNDTLPFRNGLNPSDPSTYTHDQAKRNFTNYADADYHIGPQSTLISWNSGSPQNVEVSSTTSESTTTGWNLELKLGVQKENEHNGSEIFDIGFQGSYEQQVTVTTKNTNKFEVVSNLNDPHSILPNQLESLKYNVFWIKPNHTEGVNNWWLPEGAEDQDTWCITYELQTGDDKGPDGGIDPVTDEETNNTTVSPHNNNGDQPELSKTALSQNYPNPFEGTTKFKYQVGSDNLLSGSQESFTKLIVYDIKGHQIATLVNEIKAPGSYEVEWDASQFTPGVYFYSLQSGSFKDVKKLILLK